MIKQKSVILPKSMGGDKQNIEKTKVVETKPPPDVKIFLSRLVWVKRHLKRTDMVCDSCRLSFLEKQKWTQSTEEDELMQNRVYPVKYATKADAEKTSATENLEKNE